MVEGSTSKNHRVVIGPFRRVAPAGSRRVPVVAPCWVTDDALWKTLPHNKSKVHLWERKVKTEAKWKINKRMSSEDIKVFVKTDKKRSYADGFNV